MASITRGIRQIPYSPLKMVSQDAAVVCVIGMEIRQPDGKHDSCGHAPLQKWKFVIHPKNQISVYQIFKFIFGVHLAFFKKMCDA